MRAVLLFLLFAQALSLTAQSEPVYRTITHNAFRRGEKLSYRIHYGFIDAVTATIEILPEERKFRGRNTLHIVGIGKSKGAFDFFFKVRDRYETYLDEQALIPWFFGRRIDEGGYRMAQDYVFHHHLGKVNVGKDRYVDIWQNTQDMLSGFYVARTMDLSAAKEGQIFSVPTIVDGEMYNLQIKFKGRETINSEWGKIRCLKFVPVLQKGRIFKREEDMVVWLSDDPNHIPIRANADILFGSLKVDLTDYRGVVTPFKFY